MSSAATDNPADVLAQAVAGAGADRETLLSFLRDYYRHVPDEDLAEGRPEDLLVAATFHRQTAQRRTPGQANVAVASPSHPRAGALPSSVLDIVTDDMPFLVDSVNAELGRLGRTVRLLVHPQLVVRRDAAGELLEVLGSRDGENLPEDALVESWIHLEIDRVDDEAVLAELGGHLARVLADVRRVVEDWPAMRAQAEKSAVELPSDAAGHALQEAVDARELLRWLIDQHFTFLGYNEYVREPGQALRVVAGSGLGLLRPDGGVAATIGDPVAADAGDDRPLLTLTKAGVRSTVRRRSYLDDLAVRTFDVAGELVGVRRFVGLFGAEVDSESVTRIPLVRRKVAEVLARSGYPAESYSGRELIAILETLPRQELFRASVTDLLHIALEVLPQRERRRVRLFLRRDEAGHYLSALVFLPRDRYTTRVRMAMAQVLRQTFGADSVEFTARVSESALARLHFVVRLGGAQPAPSDVDRASVEARLSSVARSWSDELSEAAVRRLGQQQAGPLLSVYADAFPEAYKEDFPATVAVTDAGRLAALVPGGPLELAMYAVEGAAADERRLKLYRVGSLSLSDVLPVLQELGVDVLDERPYQLQCGDGERRWIYDFGLRYRPGSMPPPPGGDPLFMETLAAVWAGRAESDGFNALVTRGRLSWRQVVVLRAYARYLRQASSYSQDRVAEVLNANVPIAGLLVRLFEALFDPSRGHDAGDEAESLTDEITAALDEVASLDHDRILRSLLTLVLATVRTNHFQTGSDGEPKAYLALKLDPQRIPDLPLPRPQHEIWVYAPRFEGVHLRFGAVARGGLRWSDRREDFRTEVLGLVKAQMVKNAVIVPVGAKGGFVGKRLPDIADRDAWLAEGIACYRGFISGLLDLTDNLVDGQVVPPRDVVRLDGDDSYLVVAADKGTATFSDIANDVAGDYGFWLGDAFASGGSAGYDHKAMGITARGAWESVKRHFRELGVDTQRQDFTVVGIGDMSGDVFGNGMLLSEHIRLVAAFDHRHIFLDPDPDAAVSFAERRRLFDLPRSSWADYDPSLISAGGGVFPRSAKRIPVSAEVLARLGVPAQATGMAPQELMRAILAAPADLFWNGGIGTYVKASTETNAQVGDKANDGIRVDGADLRVRVVGEGGNLGLTQLGRIEYALAGGRLNTDAIDNSAGVDTSDHEVNFKVLLQQAVRDGELSGTQRNELLAQMTDDVAALVLAHNYSQNVALATARQQAPSMLPVHGRLMRQLEATGALDRDLEFLPSQKVLDQRAAAGGGLTSSELSVLLAYAKITLTTSLLGSALPEEPWFDRALRGYFPADLVDRYGERPERHPLRREIITTAVVNDIVDRGGITFVFRAIEETGASPAEVVRAYTVAREIFAMEDLWRTAQELDDLVPTAAVTAVLLEGRRLLDRTTRWLLQSRRSSIDVAAEVSRFRSDLAALTPELPRLLVGAEADRLHRRTQELVETGLPDGLALRAAALLDAFSLLDVVEVSAATGRPAADVAELYYALSDRYEVDRMLNRITALPRTDRWQSLARSSLRYDLYAALAGLTSDVLRTATPDQAPAEAIEAWEQRNGEGLARARGTLEEILAVEKADLATLSVALRTIRTLLPG
ncbi:MAG: gdhB1 [Frankiales bacterium]|nr:gdhB1 [Frankiales bacterium]